MTVTDTRATVYELMRAGQQQLCAAFEATDGQQHFIAYSWERPGGGGGTARIMTDGAVFERAGVNVSAVYGEEVPPSIWQHRPSTRGQPYFATGISMVLHPRNPYVPAFHANFRYFEAGEDWWFGGGMDLTPSYGFEEDARHFHVTLRDYCARHPIADYQTMKETCDRYFFLKHRNEMRGIGGIFFDDLNPAGTDGFERAFAFVSDGITTILNAYLPIVHRRMHTPYGERERSWQLYRRGRYVEFNLIYDRGTLFGLQTGGNIEAILMSLPPLARWEFNYQPEPGSPEAAMAEFLRPRDWAAA
ncbi:oxygen-dependent coproporphyrinogen oxidase [Chloroflexus sp.]|uniref:oxygen-dependent coproporphyrinogen oxidase n=1 Tax=Chloroflexus sp. TaxID=1904827 RepID=UPI00262E0767|nr:oxygen-dependent coproporphyrinogen oxidase [uncultured Chloroflexus sp.]